MAADRLRETLDELARRAEEAGSDAAKLEQVLAETAEIASTTEDIHALARQLIERAILAGVNPRALYDKPFSGTYVRAIYNRLREQGHDLPELNRGGPRFRRKPS